MLKLLRTIKGATKVWPVFEKQSLHFKFAPLFSSLQENSIEKKKVAFSRTHEMKPKDLEFRLQACKSLEGRSAFILLLL